MEPQPQPSFRGRSTLNDVAERAGVSTSTVSLVLTGKSASRRIAEETRVRVLAAAAEVGYTPNLLHRSLRRGKTHIVSLYNAFRNREWSDLYMDRVAAAVEHAGGAFGYDVLVYCNFERTTQETYEILNGGLSDGLILFGPTRDEPLLPLLRQSTLPTVVMGSRLADATLPVVGSDDESGMRLVAEALVRNGHKRIAVVAERVAKVLDPTGRYARLQRFLAEHDIAIGEENVALWRGDCEVLVDEILALPCRPTAVFVWHDRLAYRLIETLEGRGTKVPGDLSVVGFDGLVWPSVTANVVTSVAVPVDEIAKSAMNILHQMISGEPYPPSVVVPVEFFPGTTLLPAP